MHNVLTAPEQGSAGLETPAEEAAEHQWQAAGDRVLLYLRCRDFSAPRGLELALEALKEAERSLARGSGNSPMVEAMQSLHRLLAEMRSGDLDRHGSSLSALDQPPVRSWPPGRRLSMVPEGVITNHRRVSPPTGRQRDSPGEQRDTKGSSHGAGISP